MREPEDHAGKCVAARVCADTTSFVFLTGDNIARSPNARRSVTGTGFDNRYARRCLAVSAARIVDWT